MISLFLAGDVMTGRGIDQVLPYPADARLHEPCVKSAHDYVELAERANGPITKPMAFGAIWGDALAVLERRRPDARIITGGPALHRRRPRSDLRHGPSNSPTRRQGSSSRLRVRLIHERCTTSLGRQRTQTRH